jgi:hypothetical protein
MSERVLRSTVLAELGLCTSPAFSLESYLSPPLKLLHELRGIGMELAPYDLALSSIESLVDVLFHARRRLAWRIGRHFGL